MDGSRLSLLLMPKRDSRPAATARDNSAPTSQYGFPDGSRQDGNRNLTSDRSRFSSRLLSLVLSQVSQQLARLPQTLVDRARVGIRLHRELGQPPVAEGGHRALPGDVEPLGD